MLSEAREIDNNLITCTGLGTHTIFLCRFVPTYPHLLVELGTLEPLATCRRNSEMVERKDTVSLYTV